MKNTKTLSAIQTVCKVGKVLSTIVFIFCIVGIVGCALGIIGLALPWKNIQIGGTTIHGFIEENADVSIGTCYASMAMVLALCIGEAVLSKLAQRYFRCELEAGTPFTFAGAREMLRLGICAICIPVVSQIVAAIIFEVMHHYFPDAVKTIQNEGVSVGLGIMFIVTSLLCKYGAEISQPEQPAE